MGVNRCVHSFNSVSASWRSSVDLQSLTFNTPISADIPRDGYRSMNSPYWLGLELESEPFPSSDEDVDVDGGLNALRRSWAWLLRVPSINIIL